MIRGLLSLVLITAPASSAAFGADSTAVVPEKMASLTVTASPDSTRLFVDGSFCGYTPARIDTLLPGTHVLQLVHPRVSSWFTANISDSIVLAPGESRSVHYSLPHRYYFNTIPSGAEAFIGDSLAGATPLVVSGSLLLKEAILEFRKGGFEPAVARIADLSSESLVLALRKASGEEADPGLPAVEYGPAASNGLQIQLTGYSTLIFGAAAAYLKIRADKANDTYLETQNPFHLSRRKRLDTQAAITTVVTELCLGLFIYFLLSE